MARRDSWFLASIVMLPAIAVAVPWGSAAPMQQVDHPPGLVELAQEFRAWRSQPEGISDFAELAQQQRSELAEFRGRLAALDDVRTWTVHAQVDYLVLRSEMDREQYRLDVLRPWSRNPAFYTEEAIGRVRRRQVAGRRVRPGTVPYGNEDARAILDALAEVEPILAQAPENLTEAVPELADMAMRHPGGGYLQDFDRSRGLVDIREDLADWVELVEPHFPEPERSELPDAAAAAADALFRFGEWIQANRATMDGSSVIGEQAFSWYLHRVLLLPYSTDELMTMASMERDRALSFFELESFKNREQPMIRPAETGEEYLAWDLETSLLIRRFYKDLLTDPDYALPVRSDVGEFQPPFGELYFPIEQELAQYGTEENPQHRIVVYPPDHWKWRYSNMGFRTAPGVLHMHEYYPGHYLEGEMHRRNACPVRAGHRDSVHSQGWCFYNEEMPMVLDFPYIRGPRARELININIYQRSIRILIGIPLLRGDITVGDALERLQSELPPMGPALGARPEEAFEEIYPILDRGATDTCMIGKAQIYRMLADRRLQLGEDFDLKAFHDELMRLGSIPLALTRWEMTGFDDQIDQLFDAGDIPLQVGNLAAR